MQSITPVTASLLRGKVQEMRYKFEIYNDSSAWVDICHMASLRTDVLTAWEERQAIAISGDYIDAELTDFPVLVQITSDADIGKICLATGYDIRFTSSDGTTLLKYERESFTVATSAAGVKTATGTFWVKIPTLPAAGTTIYVYYGNDAATDGADGTNVWDSNFKAVYHMGDATTSSIFDSTSNNNDGTKKGAGEPADATGKINDGQDFDGTDDYISVDDDASLDITSAITVEAWVKRDAQTPDWIDLIAKGQNYYIGLQKASNRAYYSSVIGGTQYYRYFDTALIEGEWTHIAATYNSTTGAITCYRNGASDPGSAFEPAASTLLTANANVLNIGGTAGAYYTGMMDEIRISSSARSAAWLKFEYYNMNEADNCLTFRTPERITENYVTALTVTPSGAGPTPEVIAGTWSAEIANPGGIFSSYHPTSTYASYFRIGRKVRISIGGIYEGAAYYWQRIIGYMDAPQFDHTSRSVRLSGCDYSKRLADFELRSPDNYWNSTATFSTVATTSSLGSEIYAEADALEIGGSEANNVTNWTDDAYCNISSATDATGGSTYVAHIEKVSATAGWATNSNVGSVTSGTEYECSFKCKRYSGDEGTIAGFIYLGSTLVGYSGTVDASAWTVASFRFTPTSSTTMTFKFRVTGASGVEFRVDLLSIKPVTTAGINTVYTLPDASMGAYYATLNGEPVYAGDPAEKFGWVNADGSNVFAFVDGTIVTTGTDNLVVYYYTAQAPEDIVADILADAGLYASKALALAAMSYTATGITIPRVWFDAGTSGIEAIRMVCERVNYRFWFDYAGTPNFKSAPGAGPADFTFSSFGDLAALADRQDLSQLANRVVIEGIEKAELTAAETKKKSRLTGSASDSTSITTYGEHTATIQNHLFQDQTALDAMATTLKAARKDPKWYAELEAAFLPAPLEIGDMVVWTVWFSSGVEVTRSGVVQSISLKNGIASYVCEMAALSSGALPDIGAYEYQP